MTKSHLPQAVAALAAAVTTLVLFSSVISLADNDKAALAAAHVKPTTLAENSGRAHLAETPCAGCPNLLGPQPPDFAPRAAPSPSFRLGGLND